MNTNSSTKGKRTVVEVSFRPAKGGVVSETRTETKRGGQGGGPSMDYDQETAVHPTAEDAHAHLDKMMAGCWGKGSETPETADRDTAADKE
jgi:hypothetical protein